jgi:hypothetical protein
MSATSGPGKPAKLEVSSQELEALRLALLEVVTGYPQPPGAVDERLLEWLHAVLGATGAPSGWTLALAFDELGLVARRLDDEGSRVALSAERAGFAALLSALRRARAAMMDSEVRIRMRAPVDVVDSLQARLAVLAG